jgi:hypothetical protein
MDATESPVWLIGDLSDAWVVSIAEALAGCGEMHRLDCPGDLPDRPFDRGGSPRLIILHRHRLTAPDAERVLAWRDPEGAHPGPALVLCISPYVRYEELERWGRLAELVVSEATAAEVLPRQVARLLGQVDERGLPDGAREFRIEVAGGDGELCRALAEACAVAGFRAEARSDRGIGEIPRSPEPVGSPPPRLLTIWEVPVLEPEWAERLERHSRRTGPVIALVGFADRASVARARANGAAACLDLPCNLDDLLEAIARTVRALPPRAWPVPARVEPPHALPPPPRRRVARPDRSAASPPWSDRGPLPRIPETS